MSLTRRLFERGYNQEDILGLFRFIDWVMVLPKELAHSFIQEVRSYEDVQKMRYVTSIERLAKEEGMIETNRENVVKILQKRFEVIPEPVVGVISGIEDLSVLQTLFTSAITISFIEEF